MDLESVRALKLDVAQRIVKPMFEHPDVIRAFSLAAMSVDRVVGPRRMVAFGAARGKHVKDYRLAVRIQQRSIQTMAALHDQILAAAKGEADIRYVGHIVKQQAVPWYQVAQRPPLIGASVGHYLVTAGSIAAFPTLNANGTPVLLSNNHVLANENRAAVGDPILQMGVADGGLQPGDVIGAFQQAIPLNSAASNIVDAAIATLDAAVIPTLVQPAALTGWGVLKPGLRPTPLDPGDTVHKIGRTTGLTSGTVSAIEVDGLVFEYETGNYTFDQQIEIEGNLAGPFSSGGDSGSLIFDDQGCACGLLCAGSDQGGANGTGVTYANNLSTVLQQLGIGLG